MKHLLFVLLAVFILSACNEAPQSNGDNNATAQTEQSENPWDNLPDTGNFGAEITEDGIVPFETVLAKLEGEETVEAKITAEITSCCQKKGCWMMVKADDGTEMRITFKDYEFFVPKNAAGKTAIMEGVLYRDTTTVEMLRHFAEDAGKSEEEILAITDPEIALAFEARGVLIK